MTCTVLLGKALHRGSPLRNDFSHLEAAVSWFRVAPHQNTKKQNGRDTEKILYIPFSWKTARFSWQKSSFGSSNFVTTTWEPACTGPHVTLSEGLQLWAKLKAAKTVAVLPSTVTKTIWSLLSIWPPEFLRCKPCGLRCKMYQDWQPMLSSIFPSFPKRIAAIDQDCHSYCFSFDIAIATVCHLIHSAHDQGISSAFILETRNKGRHTHLVQMSRDCFFSLFFPGGKKHGTVRPSAGLLSWSRKAFAGTRHRKCRGLRRAIFFGWDEFHVECRKVDSTRNNKKHSQHMFVWMKNGWQKNNIKHTIKNRIWWKSQFHRCPFSGTLPAGTPPGTAAAGGKKDKKDSGEKRWIVVDQTSWFQNQYWLIYLV